MQTVFFLMFKALGILDRHVHHLSYQDGPNSPPHFLCVDQFGLFWLGDVSEKNYVLSQGSDIAFIGHWPRAIYLLERHTDSQTDIQTGRQTYILPCLSSLTPYHCLPIYCLQIVCELYNIYISSVSLPLNEPYQTLVSLRVGMITLHFLWGDAWYASYFGCEATDWLRSIWSSCKRFRTCCHFGWSLRCSDT